MRPYGALPADPLWRPALVAPDGLVRRYQPQHLLAIHRAALRVILRNPEAMAAAGRAFPTLPERVQEHLEAALEAAPESCGEPGSWPDLARCLAWDLLYWNEPDLYDRLTEGEPLHPGLLEDLPLDGATLLDVGAGTGRLTLVCAARAARVYALEPADPLRDLLSRKLEERGLSSVIVLAAWCHSIPLPDSAVDLVVSAAAFGANPARGGDAGLQELRRVTRPGGRIAILWPDDPQWFLDRGFQYHAIGGPMEVRFRDLATAESCAQIFYPPVVLEHLRRTGRPIVPFELIGVNAPRDICTFAVP